MNAGQAQLIALHAASAARDQVAHRADRARDALDKLLRGERIDSTEHGRVIDLLYAIDEERSAVDRYAATKKVN